ncbi:hypothetical protein F2Q65_09310 [Thiohalocapsa marina]|uniref:Uncharacterized protein n=1 Tax=Thiohalocapsa marina TaxID=424902 RepID=A0A5M8FKQ6_9GAMM|nr:hypothetical protein [Thiohalocapsa marina]KAA6185287.1 hypothetical protein F2Q65_09310 [Thiohalocapsa marina]
MPLVFVAVIVYGIAQFIAAWAGIELYLGPLWAGAALLVAVFFRFTLPVTLGAFFGAMDVWQWHWALAAVFAAPGLVFVVPGVISGFLHRGENQLR